MTPSSILSRNKVYVAPKTYYFPTWTPSGQNYYTDLHSLDLTHAIFSLLIASTQTKLLNSRLLHSRYRFLEVRFLFIHLLRTIEKRYIWETWVLILDYWLGYFHNFVVFLLRLRQSWTYQLQLLFAVTRSIWKYLCSCYSSAIN